MARNVKFFINIYQVSNSWHRKWRASMKLSEDGAPPPASWLRLLLGKTHRPQVPHRGPRGIRRPSRSPGAPATVRFGLLETLCWSRVELKPIHMASRENKLNLLRTRDRIIAREKRKPRLDIGLCSWISKKVPVVAASLSVTTGWRSLLEASPGPSHSLPIALNITAERGSSVHLQWAEVPLAPLMLRDFYHVMDSC